MTKKREFVQNNNNYAIAYYRFSSHAQNEASIDQQREQAHAYARGHDLKIIKEYTDSAMSGTRGDRPGFQLMLSEVGKLRPSTLILWKTDRLGRDRVILTAAKKKIRDAGCCIKYVAEISPDDSPESALIEGLMESLAEFYSLQLRQNVTRGMNYNAEHALYNGHKLLGYTVDKATKKYIVDKNTAPIIQRLFLEYAGGKPLADMVRDLNRQGITNANGKSFTFNGLRHLLKNQAYVGVYHYGDITIADGMPRLISDELFAQTQARFEKNTHKASKYHQTAIATGEEAPRYWLTGKLYCGYCGSSVHGAAGTSKTGKRHYYYACKQQRRHKCNLKQKKKDIVEVNVLWLLHEFLHDTENLTSLAVDMATYYTKLNSAEKYINSLEAELKEVEKGINNIVKAIEAGVISAALSDRLAKLEAQREGLQDAIDSEKIKQSMATDENSIKHYFEKYADFSFDDEETRNNVLEYFVDKIFLYNDKIVITWYYTDNKTEISLNALTELANPGRKQKTDAKRETLEKKCSPLIQSCPANCSKLNTYNIIVYKNVGILVMQLLT